MQKLDEYPVGTAFNGCYLCRASRRADEDFVVDTERDIDFEGFLVLCQKCVAELGSMVGYVPSKKSDDLQKKLDGLHEDYKTILAELADKDQLISLLRQYTDEPDPVKVDAE